MFNYDGDLDEEERERKKIERNVRREEEKDRAVKCTDWTIFTVKKKVMRAGVYQQPLKNLISVAMGKEFKTLDLKSSDQLDKKQPLLTPLVLTSYFEYALSKNKDSWKQQEIERARDTAYRLIFEAMCVMTPESVNNVVVSVCSNT